jgi:hypothetical protein
MPELRVPFAVDDEGRLYSPVSAEKGRNYFCPACQEPVIFRQGEIRVAHFAHKVSDTCNQETITHKTAKLLVQKAVHEWKAGKSNSPMLQRVCQICGASGSQPLPDKVDSAILEYRLEDGSVVDVALMVEHSAQAAVEIKVTHAVDELKANSLHVPFIELDGYEVIENPTVWKSITDNFKSLTCCKCKSIYLKFQDKTRQIAKASNIELPAAYYRYGLCKCWKCKREIIVLAWPKDGMHDDSAPKVKPRPRTVQYRFSKTVGSKYWVNTCPYCQSIQGDFFLYREPDGPFFTIDVEEDSPAAFDRDMMRIAVHSLKLD